MRILGVDYGEKVIGLSLSDESGTLAFAHSVLPRNGAFFGELKRLIEREEVQTIVLGEPLTQAGSENPIHAAVRTFKERLEHELGVPVVWQDERFSTFEAKRLVEGGGAGGGGGRADAQAAAVLLQRFLDIRNETNKEQ